VSKPPNVALVHKLGHLVIPLVTIDCNGQAISNESLDYICEGEGINIIDSIGQTCDCVFMNVERLSLPTWVGNPNFQTFDSSETLLIKANVRMFNSTR